MSDHRIYIGDSRVMPELDDASVHLVVTSPPYWQLKDYGSTAQIGYHDTYESYINNLNLVWQECYRVLHPGCRLCINIGDQFARAVYYGRYKVIPIRTEIIKFCETIGFDYMGAIIWQKVTTTNTTGGATIMGSFPHPRNGIVKIDYEFILLFRKLGAPPKVERRIRDKSALTTEEWNTYFAGHWNFGGVKQDGHLAMFPEELPRRLIRMFTFVGETVLDPFSGSGTTSLAAANLGRGSVGYEINRENIPVIEKKLGSDTLFGKDTVAIVVRDKNPDDYSGRLSTLPYRFTDPLKFDKKCDPKKLQFGSRVDRNSGQREEYHHVSEVVTPELVKLDNGLLVKLIGIQEKPEVNGKALDFIRAKVGGERVFLRFDVQKYDADQRLLGYLYLKNRTFINAHLIRLGLARADRKMEYRWRRQFIKLEENANAAS